MAVRASLLGSPYVQLETGGAILPLASRDAVMLAWLALVGPTTRAQMAAMLWHDRGEEQARNSLRQRLFQLRRQMGCDLIVGSSVMEFAPGVDHDLEAGSGLLGEVSLGECPALDAWLTAMRDRRAREQRNRLVEQLELMEREGQWDAAIQLAESLVAIEPLSEHAHRRVMRLQYLRGDRAAALLAFDRLERRLKDDVGTRPDAASLTLLRTIEQSDPLPQIEATQRRDVPASLIRPPALIGRDQELRVINQHLAEGRIVALIGEAGMGKSRLLQALMATRPEATLWVGRPGDAMSPYSTLARGLRDLLSKLPGNVFVTFTREVRADLVRVMPELDHEGLLRLPPTTATPLMGVKHLMRTAWPRGTSFFLDDLQFADTASTELLQQALDDDDRPHWEIVFSMRPMPDSPKTQKWVRDLIQASLLAPLMLAPLTPTHLVQFVDSLELPGIDGGELASALHHRTGGNPLFALETLKLAWSDEAWRGDAALPSPRSVTQLIEQQLALLSPPATMLARVAALAGVDFSLPLAEAVLERSALELADAWRELEARQVIRGQSFAHDLVYETVSNGVPEAIGRMLHAKIAAWLEQHESDPARVAAHHEAAGQGERAVPGLMAAARRAQEALRETERVGFLTHAADIAEARGDRQAAFECVLQTVTTHIEITRDVTAVPLLDRLDRLADSTAQRATAAHTRAYYLGVVNRWRESAQVAERALSLARESGDVAIEMLARERLGIACSMSGATTAALEHLLAVQPWIEAHGDALAVCEFHADLARTMDNAGRVDDAQRMHERSVDDARRAGSEPLRATNLCDLAYSRISAGDLNAAREALATARNIVAVFRRRGGRGAMVANVQARCDRARGYFTEALAGFAEARELGSPDLQPIVRSHEAQCWLDLGAFDRAAQCLQEIRQAPDLPPRFRTRGLILEARLSRALGQRGSTLLEEALGIAPPDGWPELRWMARLELAHGLEPATAITALETIAGEALAMGYRSIAMGAWLRACGHAADGTCPEAERLARKVLLHAAQQVESDVVPCVDRWLQPARALLAAGCRQEAADLALLGAAWVERTADQHVEPRWREAFLARAEGPGQLLQLAAKLTAT